MGAWDDYGNAPYTSDHACCYYCGKRVWSCALGERIICTQCSQRPLPVPVPGIDKQIEQAESRLAALLAKQEAMEKFGSENDYAEDDAILFKRQFKVAGPTYTYVAVKTPVGWYITGQDASHGMSFEQLVTDHLLPAKEVWVCAEWQQIS
jgi:DNA-directed RNA polymerase subunit RPC12/RpoP